MSSFDKIKSGIKGLDELIQNIRIGDNVVWQVDQLKDYIYFVKPYIARALADDRKIVYIRFAQHERIIPDQPHVKTYDLSVNINFEPFTSYLHQIILKEGEEVFYVFDCLSDLLHLWATDMMVSNFFRVTCPLLFELNTVAYFAIYRKNHSSKTIARIRETTQLLIDVYSIDNDLYVHPLKSWNRYSSTMFLPHLVRGEEFQPITNSSESTKLLSHIYGQSIVNNKLDFWDRLLEEARQLVSTEGRAKEKAALFVKLCHLVLGRESKMLELIKKCFTLADLVEIMDRQIGSGYVGGKTVGMLLSRKILLNDHFDLWNDLLEKHDSFYIGSDIFYSYIIQNGWWKLWLEHKTKEKYYETAKILKNKLLEGRFPEETREKFQEIIEYFGQSPIIIRSSSLLEDSFGNAFAGKYESIFIVNQDSPEGRLKKFEESIKIIFASTMNEDALVYRDQRGLAEQEEQMALLVQRVSGSHRKQYFFPDMAGVGISYNIFLWHKQMDPSAGLLRVVMGLGTRAVDRVEDDYPRMVALDYPVQKPHSSIEETRKYSQHKIDVLNKQHNLHEIKNISDLIDEDIDLKLEYLGERDNSIQYNEGVSIISRKEHWLITMDYLLEKTLFAKTMKRMLKTIEKVYEYPVDIEFTVNLEKDDNFRINLLQCRPFQSAVVDPNKKRHLIEKLDSDKTIFRSSGFFLGGNIYQNIDRVIFVEAQEYSDLKESERYQVARIIGQLNRLCDNSEEKIRTILLGPGRWGSTTPSLGVPVSFAEINNFKAIVEISYPICNFVPELSMGSHFFQDLIESRIYYIALYLEKESVLFNKKILEAQDNILGKILPEYEKYAHIIKVWDISLMINSDLITQDIVCYKAG